MISIIAPSRGRPQKSLEAISKACERIALSEYEVIISLDEDDPTLEKYKSQYRGVLINKNRSAIDAINNAAKVAKGDVFVVISDDTECPIFWGRDLEVLIYNKKDFIIKTQDGIQPWILTNPILDRIYYNRFGYIYHPDYRHMFADTELTCVADITGRKIKSDLLFKHNHYSVTKEKPDEISRRADATWDHGEKLFLERYKRNFDLPPGKPIEDNGMINWLKRKVR